MNTHDITDSEYDDGSSSGTSSGTSSGGNSQAFLCSICGQMIRSYDAQQHMQQHVADMTSFATRLDVPRNNSTFPSRIGGISYAQLIQNLAPTLTHELSSVLIASSTNFARNFQIPLLSPAAYFALEDDAIYDDYDANLRLADLIGKVEIGVSDISKVGKTVSKQLLDDDMTCTICLEKCKSLNNDTMQLICSHIFCTPCISKWLSINKKCPVCNIDLEDKLLSMHL